MKSNSSLIMILLSVLLFYTFTNAQYQEAKELQNVADDYRNVLRNASAIAQLRDNLLVTYDSLPSTELDRISKVLPDNADTVRLALDLDTLAAKYGIALKSIRTGTDNSNNTIIQATGSGSYEKVTIVFTFVADYSDFMAYIADIEKSLRIIDIRSVTFQTTQSGLYEFTVTADTYWLK